MLQVTGRILDPFWKKPATLDIPDIEAYPLLDSSARCPKFHSRFYVGLPATGITGEAMLLLRIYTLDVNTGELIVVGNSIVRLFNENGNEVLEFLLLIYIIIHIFLGVVGSSLIECQK